MNALRAWGVKVAVLVVAMLAAIGGWEVLKGITGQAQAQGTPVLDHLKCYKIKVRQETHRVGFSPFLRLDNQFGFEIVEVQKGQLLCVPTSKTPTTRPTPPPAGG